MKTILGWTGTVFVVGVALLSPVPAAALCGSDSDCDDGRFCTRDHCSFFIICVNDPRDCNDYNDCTQDTCNETLDRCDHAPLSGTGPGCDDWNFLTNNERCENGQCVGDPIGGPGVCFADQDCPQGAACEQGACVDIGVPPPTATRTPTPTPTLDPRPALGLVEDIVAGHEGDSGVSRWIFSLSLSRPINAPVTVNFLTANGTATGGSDFIPISGSLTIPANATTASLPAIGINGDTLLEVDENFFVFISTSSKVRVAKSKGEGIIVNDDPFPLRLFPGLAALAPSDSVTPVNRHTPLTLTWTSPARWRDITTVDLRLRGDRGIAIWLRFDETANTFGLINPPDVSLGPAFPPGSPEELRGRFVTVILSESTWRAREPDAASVDITFTLRFVPEVAGNLYEIEAAASGDAGDVRDFEPVGAIMVALPCPGDCDGDGSVSVDELVRGVNIALGMTASADCPALDTNDSGAVEVDEIIAAVNAALGECT
jgi:hypothetical protein